MGVICKAGKQGLFIKFDNSITLIIGKLQVFFPLIVIPMWFEN